MFIKSLNEPYRYGYGTPDSVANIISGKFLDGESFQASNSSVAN